MWTRGAIASLVGVLVCVQALAGLQPLPPGQIPTKETDRAYYRSTAVLEQEIAALRNRPDQAAVPQWGRFEKAVPNARPYVNPYADVSLEVKLTKPDGGTAVSWGFYDGEDTWRIRFMPDQTGTWHYEARFSDGSGQASGTFLCMGSDAPGLIWAYKNNPVWFGFKGSKAVLVRSFQVGDRFLADADNPVTRQSWSSAQRKTFLDWAQHQGYDMLSVTIGVAGILPARAEGVPPSNRGQNGRDTKGWNTPALWDAKKQQPDYREYRRLEQVLDDLADRDMLVYPLGGFFGRDSEFPKDEAGQEVYIRYTLARLGCYWNVLLNLGGPGGFQISDFGSRIRSRLQDEFAIINPQSAICHAFEGPGVTDLRQLSRVVLKNRDETKPLYAYDTLWAGSNRHPSYSPTELRKCAYVLLMSAATINFADMNGGSDSGFSGTLDLKQKVQSRHDVLKSVWDFFEGIPFWRMKPRQDLVDTGYCLAEPGQRYLVYLDRPGTVTVKIEEGSYQMAWINARDTKDVRKAGMIDSRRALTSPQEQEDWLLSLVRVEIIGGQIRER